MLSRRQKLSSACTLSISLFLAYASPVLTPNPRRTKLIDDSKSPNPRFRGLIHGTGIIVREEGLRGVYRGLFPVVCLYPYDDASHLSRTGMLTAIFR